MSETLERLRAEVLEKLKTLGSKEDLIEIKNRYLSRKGPIADLLKDLSALPPEVRRQAGEAINRVKTELEEKVASLLRETLEREKSDKLKTERLDVTLPGRGARLSGAVHPVTAVMEEVEDYFVSLGFSVAEGPEVETDYYNFEALNFPKSHPARDMQDTFFISDDLLLRTHTSPVQIRVMERGKPPLRVIAPGTVYRHDSDVTHSPMFHQVEGFMVDEAVSFADLKGTLNGFLHKLFGKERATRFRPSFFPFVEPGAEVDIECVICSGEGCRVCKNTGWLEILGAGMIHPNVFKHAGLDPKKVSGFAFGMGIERIAMLKYGIDDLRLFFENDVKFLSQFA
ncbi:MAG: phenylalanine--tRNA ligase subunit alpha [Deltaproteobacteria bacterium]|nr:phenylalanine--tRNA ligase subunit alpha [Deltaproteobacteria bacterium]